MRKDRTNDRWILAAGLLLGGILLLPAFHLGTTLLGLSLWGFCAWKAASFVGDGKGLPLFSGNGALARRLPPGRSRKLQALWVVPLFLLLPLLLWLQGKAAWGWVFLVLAVQVWILWRLEKTQPSFDPPAAKPEIPGKWIFGSLLALGGFFFFYRFNQLPAWMDNDCANCFADALFFQHGETKTPFKTVWGDNPALPYMLYGLSFKALGFSFGAAALVSSLLHLAALPLYYGFCRYFLSPGGAWLSALLFVASRWMLNFIRMPREASLLPCFEAATLFFLARSLETGKKRDFALLGLSTALLLQTYLPSRLVLFLLLGVLAGLFLFHRKFLLSHLSRLGLCFFTFALFFGPLGLWYLTHPEVLFDRMNKVSILQVLRQEGGWDPLGRFLSESFWMFNIQGGMDGHYNLPGAPLLDPLSGLCFWVGLAWCLSRCGKFAYLFLVSGFFLTFLGVALANSPGHPMRAIAMAPFVFLLAGVGADRLGRALACLWPRKGKVLISLFLAAVASSAVIWNFDGYFNRTTKDRVFLQANDEFQYLAAKALSPYPKGWDIHMDFDGAMQAFVHTYQRAEMRNFLPDTGLPVKKVPEKGAVILLDGLGAVTEDLVSAYYPSAKTTQIHYLDGRQALWAWELSRRDLDQAYLRPFPPPDFGLWIEPLDARGKGKGLRWWPALFGIQKWVRSWDLKDPAYRCTFSLKESRPLRFRVLGTLRVWVAGREREGVQASSIPKDLFLEAFPAGTELRVEYSPDQGTAGLDLFWKAGEKYLPVPSGAFRTSLPKPGEKAVLSLPSENAYLMMPDW